MNDALSVFCCILLLLGAHFCDAQDLRTEVNEELVGVGVGDEQKDGGASGGL